MGELADMVGRSWEAQDKRIVELRDKLIGLIDIVDSLPCTCVEFNKCDNCIAKDKAIRILSGDEK